MQPRVAKPVSIIHRNSSKAIAVLHEQLDGLFAGFRRRDRLLDQVCTIRRAIDGDHLRFYTRGSLGALLDDFGFGEVRIERAAGTLLASARR